MNRLKEKYQEQIAPKMMHEYKLPNVMDVPKVTKVCINSGIGSFRENRESVESFVTDLTAVTGQVPSPRQARLSVASFKVRQGDVVGYTVTLRGKRMWAFLDKFVSVALPRVRDFRGLNPDSFDAKGNYTVGVKEHVIFPEVNPNTTKGIRSLQITFAMSSGNIEQNRSLLHELGFPFKEKDK